MRPCKPDWRMNNDVYPGADSSTMVPRQPVPSFCARLPHPAATRCRLAPHAGEWAIG